MANRFEILYPEALNFTQAIQKAQTDQKNSHTTGSLSVACTDVTVCPTVKFCRIATVYNLLPNTGALSFRIKRMFKVVSSLDLEGFPRSLATSVS